MNNLEQGDGCHCTTFEERLNLIEKLMQTLHVPPHISIDRHSVGDFNLYPILFWDDKRLRLKGKMALDEVINKLTPHEFLEKAGCVHKSQGGSYIRHHFI